MGNFISRWWHSMDDNSADDINHNFKIHGNLFESQIKIDELFAKALDKHTDRILALEKRLNNPRGELKIHDR